MPTPVQPLLRRSLGLLIAALALCQTSRADDDRRAAAVPPSPRYQSECAACHVAYPPGMLPAASWQRLMKTLPSHFGTDASLDSATVKELSTWLTANAATDRPARGAPPEDRITRSAWFIRQHEEVPAAAWKLPAVQSAARCAACHTRADQGDFDERFVRIPR